MRSYSWWQMIRALAGLEPGEENNLEGLADNFPLKMDRRDILKRLAEGDAVVRGIPFDGQIHEDIPKDAWRQIYMEIRTGHPFAENYTGEDRPRRPGIGIVAVLRSGADGYRKHAGGGWHHLIIDEDQLAALRAALRTCGTPETGGNTGSITGPRRRQRRGRRPNPKWPEILAEVSARLATDGRPDKQAELEQWIMEAAERHGVSFSESTIRGQAATMFDTYEREMNKEAKKGQ